MFFCFTTGIVIAILCCHTLCTSQYQQKMRYTDELSGFVNYLRSVLHEYNTKQNVYPLNVYRNAERYDPEKTKPILPKVCHYKIEIVNERVCFGNTNWCKNVPMKKTVKECIS